MSHNLLQTMYQKKSIKTRVMTNKENLAAQTGTNPIKGEELVKTKSIPNTPFHVVKMDDKYFLAVNKYRVTELKDSEEEAIKCIETEQWNLITAVITICCDNWRNWEHDVKYAAEI